MNDLCLYCQTPVPHGPAKQVSTGLLMGHRRMVDVEPEGVVCGDTAACLERIRHATELAALARVDEVLKFG